MKERDLGIAIIVLCGMFFIVIWTIATQLISIEATPIKIDCSVQGIRLVNVYPADCYGDFSQYACPVPTTIACKGEIPQWITKMEG